MAKKYKVSILASLSKSDIIEDVRKAICREVAIGRECNFRWTPSMDPMNLEPGQWRATGSTIVADLQSKYPRLVVKRQEIEAHYSKQLTVFRGFLTGRITK